MARSLKRYIVLGLGWFIVVFGVLGIFLPGLQGILFLLIGLILLSRESACAQRQLEKLKTRYPKFAEKYDIFAEFPRAPRAQSPTV